MEENSPIYLTVREVQQRLRISRARAYQLADGNHFTVLRVGRIVRVEEAAFEEWLRERSK